MAVHKTYEQYDVIVVGHGMSGLSTGISAHEAGAKPIILEKSSEEKAGGHSRYSGGGLRFPQEDPAEVQENLGLSEPPRKYTKEDFWNDIMDVTDGRANRELCEILVEESYGAVKWLHSQGVEFTPDIQLGGEKEAGMEASIGECQAKGEGAGLIDSLTRRVKNLGIERHYDTEMRKLLTDEFNRVAGIEAVSNDGWVRYEAPAVVICAGSYISSPEKRARYFGRDGDAYVVRGSRYNTGEALFAALDGGAKSAGQWGGAHQVLLDARAPAVEGGRTRINGYQYGVILNEDGERFFDEGEDVLAKTYAKLGKAVYDQPKQSAYVIVDSKAREHTISQMKLPPIESKTLDGLMDKIDIENREKALATLEEFNEDTSKNETFDPTTLDGVKTQNVVPPKSNWAVPINEPPFYCYPSKPGVTFGFGGLKINTDCEVLNTKEKPIKGLWAVGNSTAEFFYGNYPASSALARGATFGRRAGKNAAKYAMKHFETM